MISSEMFPCYARGHTKIYQKLPFAPRPSITNPSARCSLPGKHLCPSIHPAQFAQQAFYLKHYFFKTLVASSR